MKIKSFNQKTKEHLKELGGYYVYALADPTENGKIFYVGKGEGDRVFQHARAAEDLNDKDKTSLKLQTIRRIIDENREVLMLILRHGLTEREAFIVEAVLIDLFTNPMTQQRAVDASLSNLQGGHDQRELGIRTVEELNAQYSSEPLGEVTDKLIIININDTYKNADTNIYDATRYCWHLDPKRANQADYILSEYQGIVRAVFRANEKGWQPVMTQIGKTQRYFFEGEEVKDDAVRTRYLNKQIEKKHGQANPIQYRNI